MEAREFTNGADVLANVKRTRSYFDSLRSPSFKHEAQIAELTKTIQALTETLGQKDSAIAALRAKLSFYEDPANAGVSVRQIQKTVAEFYNISTAELLAARRTAEIVGPRHVAMYLAKMMTKHSYPEIGRMFAGRDHTTVLHAIRSIETRRKLNPQLDVTIKLLMDRLLTDAQGRREQFETAACA